MKYLKTFEYIRDEYPDFFPPVKPEDEPQHVPGFELGTIDPEDDDTYAYDFDKNVETTQISEKEQYKTFLKVVKERNFTETKDEIEINMTGISQDYCMSIYNFPKHLKAFLDTELIGKYVSDGFVDIMTNMKKEGVIEKIIFVEVDSYHCSVLINFKLENDKKSDYTCVLDKIKIDKFKSTEIWKNSNKYNL